MPIDPQGERLIATGKFREREFLGNQLEHLLNELLARHRRHEVSVAAPMARSHWGQKETWRQGDVETRRQGDRGTRRQGDKETRRQGDKERKSHHQRLRGSSSPRPHVSLS